MSETPLDLAAREILRRYPLIGVRGEPVSLGNRGGFSGAKLWRVESDRGSLCLRAWPEDGPTPERLAWIHRLQALARAKGVDIVPAVHPTSEQGTWTSHFGRLWELSDWMPGRADFREQPTPARLEAACLALARLHLAWAGIAPVVDRCPAVLRRLEFAQQSAAWLASAWETPLSAAPSDPVAGWAQVAWMIARHRIHEVPQLLAPWTDRLVPLQPCLCDIWQDHVLFEGEIVSGLIDFGGVKVDHVAVDLARLLGSLVPDNSVLRPIGLRSYSRLRPLSTEEEALVTVLRETGTIVALTTWLQWLYRDKKHFEDRAAVAAHLAELVRRVDSKQ